MGFEMLRLKEGLVTVFFLAREWTFVGMCSHVCLEPYRPIECFAAAIVGANVILGTP